jgi:hypothetical protein
MGFFNTLFWAPTSGDRGRTFFVSPSDSYLIEGRAYSASNDNDGLDPRRALRTVNRAWVLVTDACGDKIVLLPGAHTVSSSIAGSKSQVHMTALGGQNFVRPTATLTTTATADEIMNLTAADIEISNIRFIPITAATAVDFTAACHRLYVHDCSFDMATPAANVATRGLGHAGIAAYTIAPQNILIQHNYFEVTGAQGPALSLGDAADFVIEKNIIAFKGGTWAQATLQGGVLGWGVYRENEVHCFKNGTITAGITGTDLTSTLSVAIYRNLFSGTQTKPIEDWGATDATIAENYKTENGGAAGGVLWSSIT